MSKIRIARPVRNLHLAIAMNSAGFNLRVVGEFEDHQGFSGTMLGRPGSDALPAIGPGLLNHWNSNE